METQEKLLFNNEFGKVTDKRVVLYYKSGVEDVPVGKITSISLQHRRNYFFAVGGYVIAVAMIIFLIYNLETMPGAMVLIVIALVMVGTLSGFANWIGNHNIVLSTSGQNREPLKVEFSKTKEGRQFVDAIRKVVFK
ncbi:MAG: hypothetical protein M3R17_15885 [Bacteroidota bacterium]|nr:hypothetical protein [Bacteroidota bacterium]